MAVRTPTTLSENLRYFRKMAGLTQAQLGEHIGIAAQQIQKYEYGHNRVSVDALVKFSEILDVPVLDLIGRPQPVRDSFAALEDVAFSNLNVRELVDIIARMDQPTRNRLLSYAQLLQAAVSTDDSP